MTAPGSLIPGVGSYHPPMTSSGGGVISFPGGAPTQPSVHIFDPPDNLGAIVPIVFLVNDPGNNPMDLTFEIDDGSGTFRAGTLATGSDPLTRVPAPSTSTDFRILWNAGADLGPNVKKTVQVRLTPRLYRASTSTRRLSRRCPATPWRP